MKAIRVFMVVVAVVAVFAAGALAVAWFGIYDVAADKPQWKILSWYVKEVRRRSIAVRSRNIAPVSSVSSALTEKVSYYYYGTCVLCHGAEGNPPEKFTRGLDPTPPDFVSPQWDIPGQREMFWIIKNGIKMTAMASFGKEVFKDDEVWAMVDFLKKLHQNAEK